VPAPAAHCWATSSSRVGLAHAGLAGQQHHRAGHQTAAEHPVELADPLVAPPWRGALIVAIGRAGSAGMRELTTRPATEPRPVSVDSMTSPHSPHPGQRPEPFFGGLVPQASQTKAGRAAFGAVRRSSPAS
jgi:hypothetical protein